MNVGADPDDLPAQVAWYEGTIAECGNRPVSDIDVNVSLEWLGNGTVTIAVSVHNNEATVYDGHIRVYVTEKVSRRGWRDSHNRPYEFAFLDYAFDQAIHIDPAESWDDTAAWNGNNHDDGYGNDFGDLAEDNVMVIAAVFNSEWHQGYAYPDDPEDPHPFDAYYVDETAAASLNGPPLAPSNPSPVDNATGVGTDVQLTWTGADYDPADTLTYDVYFGTSIFPPRVASDEPLPTYAPGTLDYNTTYFWRVVAFDNHGDSTSSGLAWRFTTDALPYEPSNPGPADSAVDVSIDADLSWTGGDPDPGDTVTYDVYFGTEVVPPQIATRQLATTCDPGTMECDTTYYWQVVAFDRHDASIPGSIWQFRTEAPQWVCGDCNGDDRVTVADATYLVAFIYRGGPAPLGRGDVNLDDRTTIADATYLVAFIYRGGPAPCEPAASILNIDENGVVR